MVNHIVKTFLLLNIIFITTILANDKVSLQLQWKHQFEFAGFYMAKEKGFYDEVSLDVEFREFDSNINIIENVLSEKTTYGLTYSNIISSYLNGKPVVFIANILKYSPLAIATSTNIKMPKELIGKKIMGLDKSLSNTPLLSMLKQFDVKLSDMRLVKPSFDINDLIDEKVDGMVVFTTNEIYELDRQGFKYNIFKPSTYGVEFYDLNIFTSKKEALNNPIRVQNFKNASLKGWEYAINNIDETIEVILKKYNTQNKTKEHLRFEAIQIKNTILPNIFKLGSIQKEKVTLIAQSFQNLGIVKNTDINFNDFLFECDCLEQVQLTPKERNYLNIHNTISVHNESDWAPYNFNKDGKAYGYSIDYMQLLASKLNINIEFISGYSWSQYLTMIKTGKLDVMMNIAKTLERKKYLLFTTPYLNIIDATFTKKGNTYNSLKELNGKTISVVKGFYEEELLKNNYPNINILTANNSLDALKLVEFGKADATLNILAVGNHLISEYGLTNLRSSFEVDDINFNLELHLATSTNNKTLKDILNKAKDLITEDEIQQLRTKWLEINKTTLSQRISLLIEEIDYELIRNIFIGFIIFILLFIYRQYTLNKLNKELERRVKEEVKKSKEKDNMIFQQSKLVSMGEMIANISHQWRQPLSSLNGIFVNLDYAYEHNKLDKETFNNHINDAEVLTSYMSNTIEDFSNFFSPTKQKENFNINELLSNTKKMLSSSLKEYQISLELDAKETITINSYKSELIQVILILTNNAKDAYKSRNIKDGKIKLNLTEINNNIFITIKDDAGGIDKNIIDNIFEPYFTTKNKSIGTGLGLYIANTIVTQSLDGQLSVKNESNGSKFIIQLKKQTIP